jgi:hypothetical protein
MRTLLVVIALLAITNVTFSQNVGIGTVTPAAKLDVKANSSYVGQFNGLAPMYMGIFENDLYRGYWGSYSGAAEDVDFGTGSGTTGKLHLTIQANPKMTINNAGQVGIGTTSPAHLMHVNGGDMFVESSSGKIIFGYNTGGSQWRLASTGGGADLRWQTYDGVTETSRHYFSQNGNVGIGTGIPVPAARLHVSTTASETIRMEGNNPYLSFYDNTDGYQGYLWYNGSDMVLGSSTAAVRFASSGYRMSINTDGRVSIGSSNNPATGYLLSVDGKVISEEIKVQLSGSWPDYVFGDNYKLMPIEELEKSIRQNKHLPNIPSAADVTAEKGIELGEMNRKLLEKVEELTLYIIQLKKENNLLEQRLNNIEKKIGGQ